MTNYDYRAPANDDKKRIVRMRELAARLALSSSHLYSLVKSGKFPKPVSLIPGGRAKGWPEHELSAWLQHRIEVRDSGTQEADGISTTPPIASPSTLRDDRSPYGAQS